MIGKTIHHYMILEKLGTGGMGTVYKARDSKLDRFVALKFLAPHLSRAEEEKKRFIHEAKAASALDHSNICTIHDINETEDGQMFIAMACYEGESLKVKIDRGPMPVEEVLDIAIQIARGLEKAHAKEIVHRDIKPANILITEDSQAKLVDFGLAKLAGRTILTREGTTLGTVAYMSPEQTEGTHIDHRADIWALGVVLYEMLCGERPFKGEYEQAVMYSILNEEPEPLRKVNPAVPKELEEVVLHTLAKNPTDRYQTSEEIQKDLTAISEGQKPLHAMSARGSNFTRAIKMAVLPFANLTGDIEQEYLSDGFTQEMISQLSRLHPENLSVIARSSVMRYKKGDTPIDQIGRELKVDYVLEGSTRREAKQLRISTDLIQVRDQTQIWGDTYEREFSDILKLQSEVAKNVAEALALKLLPAEKARVNSVQTVNPEAYEAYLKGLSHFYKIAPAELETARHYFELALDKDPNYALAHTGIALIWIGLQQMSALAPSVATPKAKEAALRALELDDTLAEVHYTWALIKTWSDWDWEGAEQAFQRALEINPNYPDALVYYSNLLCYMGRLDEALAYAERAVELDPFNSLYLSLSTSVLIFMRRWDDAIERLQNVLKTSPHDLLGNNGLWGCFHMKGMYEEALKSAKRFFAGIGLAELADIMTRRFEEAGYSEAMILMGNTLTEMSRETYFSPYFISYLYLYAGNKDKTLECLEKAYEVKDPMMPYLVEPCFDILLDEPRFQDLLRKMNLPMEK